MVNSIKNILLEFLFSLFPQCLPIDLEVLPAGILVSDLSPRSVTPDLPARIIFVRLLLPFLELNLGKLILFQLGFVYGPALLEFIYDIKLVFVKLCCSHIGFLEAQKFL